MPDRPRKNLTVRVVPLGSPEAGAPPCPPDPAGRLELLTRLSRESWELSGRPWPSYTRETMPVVIRTLRDQGAD